MIEVTNKWCGRVAEQQSKIMWTGADGANCSSNLLSEVHGGNVVILLPKKIGDLLEIRI